jgi:hypothetical protein
MPFSIAQKRKEIERELQMRRIVYRKQVRDGRMSPQEARDRIAIMEAILEDYATAHEPTFLDSHG